MYPGIAVNPLRDCLFKTLELSDQRAIPFLVRPVAVVLGSWQTLNQSA